MMYRALHRFPLLRFGVVAAFGLAGGSVQASDLLVKKAMPHVWIEPLVPEKLPDLKHPAYYEALDKAKAQLAAGRYKLALATLHAAGPDAEPLESALVSGAALSALGRTDEALAALTTERVADAPRAQVLRATVLARVGKE